MSVRCSCGVVHHGGMLDFNGNNVAGCSGCGWRGAPTFTDGQRSDYCPVCETPAINYKMKQVVPRLELEEYEGPRHQKLIADLVAGPRPMRLPSVSNVGRNTLCPCGSGRKFKKCCGI